jgi:hypothetical protein
MQGHITEPTLFGEGQNPTKVCVDCRTRQPIDEFGWTRLGRKSPTWPKKYRSSICKSCKRRRAREWNAKHRKTKVRDQNYRKSYGITKAAVDAMSEAQSGACLICGDTAMPIDPRTKEPYELAVDHCHDCGTVRALLCPNCNNGLGCFRDDPERLEKAILYLRRHVCTKPVGGT